MIQLGALKPTSWLQEKCELAILKLTNEDIIKRSTAELCEKEKDDLNSIVSDLIQECDEEIITKNKKESYVLKIDETYFPFSNLLNMNDVCDISKTVTSIVGSIQTKNKKSTFDIWLENQS